MLVALLDRFSRDRTRAAMAEEDEEEAAAMAEVIGLAGVQVAAGAVPVECFACPAEAMSDGVPSVDEEELQPGELVCLRPSLEGERRVSDR